MLLFFVAVGGDGVVVGVCDCGVGVRCWLVRVCVAVVLLLAVLQTFFFNALRPQPLESAPRFLGAAVVSSKLVRIRCSHTRR